MTQIPVKRLLTFEAYLEYDDGTDTLYELVDGELVPMTPASPEHSDMIDLLYDAFKAQVKQLGLNWVVKQVSVGIRTKERQARLLDVSVIAGEAWQQLRLQKSKSAVLQVPLLLAVEVVSPGERNYERDYVEKKQEYAARMISEYWIVDPQGSKVSVLLLQNNTYQATEFTRSQRIISATFPELGLTAEQVLQAGAE